MEEKSKFLLKGEKTFKDFYSMSLKDLINFKEFGRLDIETDRFVDICNCDICGGNARKVHLKVKAKNINTVYIETVFYCYNCYASKFNY